MVEDFASASWEDPSKQSSPLEATIPNATVTNASVNESSLATANETIDKLIIESNAPESVTAESESSKPAAPPAKTAPDEQPSKIDPYIYVNSLVNSPQKEQDGSQNAYISYLVTTESNSPTFQSPMFRVRRRYTDFYFLYSTLCTEYPACAVPPLADKSRLEYIKGDRFGTEFTLKRASSLNRFLDRISLHPILKKSMVYLSFLETPDWNSFKRSLSTRQVLPAPENTVLEGVSDSLLDAISKVNKHGDELTEVKERIGKLEESLLQVEKTLVKVLRRQSDLSYDLEDFSQQLIKLAGLEYTLEKEIIAFANGTHNLAQGVTVLREQTDSDYVVSLRDMQYYSIALRNLIKLREQKQLDYESLTDHLNRAVHDRDTILSGGGSNFLRNKIEDVRGVNHEAARKERLRKLEVKISNLKQEVESAKKGSETLQELAVNEVSIFEHTKQLEMKKTLSGLADSHINFYQNIISNWEAVL